ncbi:MAG: septation protein IspZ [Paracoccaceae bacterium]|jgi:intracellular septation protein|nr:MAG: Intracellular septation protein A [Rhodobacter sp. BACL10 MAG-121220-bin24]MDO7559441.1 septation protein IspZ [Paracoccaceae bacterium]HAQ46703.1 intracellular septation protein A [Rhodobacter sp.]MDO7568064.1 septation protein IspZ [Paracoccaceae bacterium]MDO7633028.1 septation protein IspZ [Paracoccaceae bacterium]
MSKKKINPILKLSLEIGPVLAFFVLYSRLKGQDYTLFGASYEGFILATAAFVPILILSTGLLWWLTGVLSKMQIVTLVLVILFGGLSVWFNDPRFFKTKPTLIYLLFGSVLGFGLLRGRSYLAYVMHEAIPLASEGWMILTRRVTAFFFGLALTNEVIWRSFSTDVWVNFKTFGLTIAIFAFFMSQGQLFTKYGLPKDDGPK